MLSKLFNKRLKPFYEIADKGMSQAELNARDRKNYGENLYRWTTSSGKVFDTQAEADAAAAAGESVFYNGLRTGGNRNADWARLQQEETQASIAARKAREEAERQRQAKLAQDEAYGTDMSLGTVQDLFTSRKEQGIAFQKSAADIARDIINGVQPTAATTMAQNTLDSSIFNLGGVANAQPTTDAALVSRNAMNAVQQQQRQALMNSAMARAQEVAQARDIAAKAGLNIQSTGLTDYGNVLKARQGLQQAAANEKTTADNINRQTQAQESASGAGLLGAGIGAAAMAFSDRNTKENIRFVGLDKNGLKTYLYRYKPELLDHPLAVEGDVYGYMADEVEALYPEAVVQVGKYKAVDYTKIPKGDK